MSVNERWSYGMAAMKYNVQPNQMPPPGAAYTNGEMYSKFRKAGATGSY